MSLTDPPAYKPDRSRAMAFTVAALAVVAIVRCGTRFATIRRRKPPSVSSNALVAGDTTQAYQLWKPGRPTR